METSPIYLSLYVMLGIIKAECDEGRQGSVGEDRRRHEEAHKLM
jgi:hypothetical protein